MIFLAIPSLQAQQAPYKNSKTPTEKRVQDLLGRMTKEEKVGQLSKLLGWEMYEKGAKGVGVSAKLKKQFRISILVCFGLHCALIRGLKKRF